MFADGQTTRTRGGRRLVKDLRVQRRTQLGGPARPRTPPNSPKALPLGEGNSYIPPPPPAPKALPVRALPGRARRVIRRGRLARRL